MEKDIAFIFDLDGTLWDARESVAKAWQKAAMDEFGFTHISFDLVASLMGKTMEEIAREISPSHLSEEDKQKFGKKAFAYENEYLAAFPGKLFFNEVETLTRLKERGHRLFVVSNCQNGYIENFLPTVLPFLFDGYLCYGDTGKEKAFTIREIMDRNGIERAVYVGDTLGDEKQAHLAGLPFVYASYGFGKSEKPDFVINSIEDLLSL